MSGGSSLVKQSDAVAGGQAQGVFLTHSSAVCILTLSF